MISNICFWLPDCREDLRFEFTKLRFNGINAVRPNMQNSVFCEGARSESGKNYLLRLYKETRSIAVRERINRALEMCYKQAG